MNWDRFQSALPSLENADSYVQTFVAGNLTLNVLFQWDVAAQEVYDNLMLVIRELGAGEPLMSVDGLSVVKNNDYLEYARLIAQFYIGFNNQLPYEIPPVAFSQRHHAVYPGYADGWILYVDEHGDLIVEWDPLNWNTPDVSNFWVDFGADTLFYDGPYNLNRSGPYVFLDTGGGASEIDPEFMEYCRRITAWYEVMIAELETYRRKLRWYLTFQTQDVTKVCILQPGAWHFLDHFDFRVLFDGPSYVGRNDLGRVTLYLETPTKEAAT